MAKIRCDCSECEETETHGMGMSVGERGERKSETWQEWVLCTGGGGEGGPEGDGLIV